MDATEVPEGIDPKNACKVEVNVNSYFSIIDGKRVYNRGRTVSWDVDSEEYSVIDLEKDVVREGYFWDSNQKANFWVLTGSNLTCKLSSDGQLLDLLRASQLVKFLMIVGIREEGDGMPAIANMVGEDRPTIANVVEEMKIGGFEWAEVPQYGETSAGPSIAEEEEKEHFMTVGCDPHGDEPTGVDEEWRYFNNVDSAIHDAQPVENIKVQAQKRKRPRPIPEFDTECVPDDEAAMVDDEVVPHTTHDKENLVIKEGDTFIDKDNFIKTMRTYSIRNEFETRVEHSDRDRYRARCAYENCNRRVFAKKLYGGNTFMVVKFSKMDDHTCSSSATMKGHQASTALDI